MKFSKKFNAYLVYRYNGDLRGLLMNNFIIAALVCIFCSLFFSVGIGSGIIGAVMGTFLYDFIRILNFKV